MKVKDFTQVDWDAFAGCESENPKIGNFKITEIDLQDSYKQVTAEGVLILDGDRVQIHMMLNDESEEEFTLDKEFENPAVAQIFVNGMEDNYSEWYLLSVLHFETVL